MDNIVEVAESWHIPIGKTKDDHYIASNFLLKIIGVKL